MSPPRRRSTDAREADARPGPTGTLRPAPEHSRWYKDAIVYQTHVRAFADSDGDGIGDLRGLTQRLDYLADLGVTAVWLLPFYPSPLKDDGYDIADYTSIHPSYGTLRDFRSFLRAAHDRELKVITELVLNHTSDEHPWFRRARRAKAGTTERDFYVWSDTPERYKDARIIFKDFEHSNWAWDPVAGAYYWHRFYTHQPDLNFDNPAVAEAVYGVLDFWLQMGVDGLRLDAVPYLFEREGTNCENLPETHKYLRDLRRYVDENYGDRMLLAEANQWPEDAVEYFGEGNECHMAFHFPLMPRMFMAIRQEDRFPVIDILEQTPDIPDEAQWAIFLRNHDELTLEMVTDEERDYMYRVYASDPQARINLGIRRRLAPLLGNNRRMIEMMNALLFSLPGTPVLYYGDEIGMGDNIYLGDRNGVRTPMQWSADRNAGFSRANPQKLYLPVIIDPEYHAEAINVESQHANPHSLLWWMKRVIALRRRSRALSRGTIEMLFPENRKVLAFLRAVDNERVLIVANLSRLAQYVELDLSKFNGMTPVEMFGGTEFPRIGELPYLITLGPHAFYWLELTESEDDGARGDGELPELEVPGAWGELLEGKHKRALERVLPAYLRTRRWFGSKGRSVKGLEITEVIPVMAAVSAAKPVGLLAFLTVEYLDGDSEIYVLPLIAKPARDIGPNLPWSAIARVRSRGGEKILYDAVDDPAFAEVLLGAIAGRRVLRGRSGSLVGTPGKSFRRLRGRRDEPLPPQLLGAEQSNTSIAFGQRLILKLIRRTEEGLNPDLEIGRHLTERTGFTYMPPLAGSIEYVRARREPMTIGVLQGFVLNEGDAWEFSLEELGRYTERALAMPEEIEPPVPPATEHVLDLADRDVPQVVDETAGPSVGFARLLGRRTAEMHLALASEQDDVAFVPEPFSMLYQRSMYQSMRALARRTFQLARAKLHDVPALAEVLDYEGDVIARYDALLERKIDAQRIRTHGDYHLGQVLWTGKDVVIIDFEGEPAKPIGERRIKRSPLRDVAGMIRSFHYAAYTALLGQAGGTIVRPEDRARMEPWLTMWFRWVSAAFVREYWEASEEATYLPRARRDLQVLLDAFLLEKGLYEIAYEINNRPDWIDIPLRGIHDLLEVAD